VRPEIYSLRFHCDAARSAAAAAAAAALSPQANIATNMSTTRHTRRQVQGTPQPVLAEQLTTAPDALRVLFLSEQRYARVCSNSTAYADAVVVHCQSFNSGAAKSKHLRKVGLWSNAHVDATI
jgi:hypothetical protein